MTKEAGATYPDPEPGGEFAFVNGKFYLGICMFHAGRSLVIMNSSRALHAIVGLIEIQIESTFIMFEIISKPFLVLV